MKAAFHSILLIAAVAMNGCGAPRGSVAASGEQQKPAPIEFENNAGNRDAAFAFYRQINDARGEPVPVIHLPTISQMTEAIGKPPVRMRENGGFMWTFPRTRGISVEFFYVEVGDPDSLNPRAKSASWSNSYG